MTSAVFVNAWVGVDNHGDELLFARLRDRLAAVGATAVTVTSFTPARTERLHGVEAVHPRNLPAVIRAIRRADLFVLGPGGLLQDTTSPWNLPYQMHRTFAARLLGTPIVGIGLGADPFRRRLSGPLLRAALGGADALAVRDEASNRALAAVGLEAVTTADLAVATASSGETTPDAIVVSLRPRRSGGFLPVRWQRHTPVGPQVDTCAAALDDVATALDLPVRFVAFEPHTDDPLHQAIATRMNRPATCTVVAHDELVPEMERAHLVIATRYHAAVTALVADRPAVLIGYAPKVRALAAAVGDDYPLLADTDAAMAGLAAAATRALAAEPTARRSALTELRAAEARNGDLLAIALGTG